MEQVHDLTGMLDLIIRPAFAVTGGMIQYCNQAARQRMISTELPIADLLETGREEYPVFSGGSLYLTLRLRDHSFGATVSRCPGFDVFILDEEESQPHLQAMALAARELRNPLGDLMIAADRLTPKDGTANQDLQLLQRSLYQMLRLVGNMSDGARYAEQDAPRQELRDMAAFIGEVFEKASHLAAQAGITLRFTGWEEVVYSLTDSEKLERAIYNMVSNAIKFSDPGSTIDASLNRHGRMLRLTVTDYGRGIPDDLMGSVFSRHLRQAGIEDPRHGIGLGMFMIRAAASAHGGTVLLEKGKEAGTKLTMTLAIRDDLKGNLASPRFRVDYNGELDHALTELADVLPISAY